MSTFLNRPVSPTAPGDPPETEREASPGAEPAQPAAAPWRILKPAPQAPSRGLSLAATPIGNLRDVTLRVLDALALADRVFAEDTRVTQRLLEAYGISRRLESYHDHNAEAVRPTILAALAAGESVVLASDAGVPLISDPGFKLVRAAIEAGHRVEALPGASASLAGLIVSGLPTDRFLFAGFPPPKREARRRWYRDLAPVEASLVMFEAPSRLAASLADACEALGDRSAATARELTKRYEETRRARLSALAAYYAEAGAPKGEVALIIGPPAAPVWDDAAIETALRAALKSQGPAQAAAAVAKASGRSKRALYLEALRLQERNQ